jgi:cyclopropane fatty-acyl-phospholipid synthase-like methyltransferase
MVRWGSLDQLPPGTTVLDVGYGIGGSSRILAQSYGFAVTGITISPQQVKRVQQLKQRLSLTDSFKKLAPVCVALLKKRGKKDDFMAKEIS